MKFKDITCTEEEVIQSLKEVGIEFGTEPDPEFEKMLDRAKLTYELLEIITELDARESTSNCIIRELQGVGWKDLCDRPIKILEKLRDGTDENL